MSFSFVIALVGGLIACLIVFLLIAVTFLNIGMKLGQKETKPIKIIPTTPKKPKESAEAKALRERMEMINNFTGYKEN